MNGGGEVVKRVIEPDLGAVEEACLNVRAGILSDLQPNDRFAIELLLREALTNAVFHGSRTRDRGGIAFEVLRSMGAVMIRVSDGGHGFDWGNWKEMELPPAIEYGLGLSILHRYASRVRFCGNGNQVELVRMLREGRTS